MKNSERQHYVPRFYLNRFTDADGHLWVYDKATARVFAANPANVANESGFYCVSDSRRVFTDPHHMERQFSELECDAAEIVNAWLHRVEQGERRCIADPEKGRMSLFLALQILRTRETRIQMVQFDAATREMGLESKAVSDSPIQLHSDLLWDEPLVHAMEEALRAFIWLIAVNNTERPLYTSDHPIHCKDRDSRHWLMGPRLFDLGAYFVYPLSPSTVLYCKEPTHWHKLSQFDCRISPVRLTEHMVDHENSGKVGMSTRFTFASKPDFAFAKMFCELHPEIVDPCRERFERTK